MQRPGFAGRSCEPSFAFGMQDITEVVDAGKARAFPGPPRVEGTRINVVAWVAWAALRKYAMHPVADGFPIG